MGEHDLLNFATVTQTTPYGQANTLLSLTTSRVARPSLSIPATILQYFKLVPFQLTSRGSPMNPLSRAGPKRNNLKIKTGPMKAPKDDKSHSRQAPGLWVFFCQAFSIDFIYYYYIQNCQIL